MLVVWVTVSTEELDSAPVPVTVEELDISDGAVSDVSVGVPTDSDDEAG